MARNISIPINIEKLAELLELPEGVIIQQAWLSDLGGGEYGLRFLLYREPLSIEQEDKKVENG